jgi:hypothetical protein
MGIIQKWRGKREEAIEEINRKKSYSLDDLLLVAEFLALLFGLGFMFRLICFKASSKDTFGCSARIFKASFSY